MSLFTGIFYSWDMFLIKLVILLVGCLILSFKNNDFNVSVCHKKCETHDTEKNSVPIYADENDRNT